MTLSDDIQDRRIKELEEELSKAHSKTFTTTSSMTENGNGINKMFLGISGKVIVTMFSVIIMLLSFIFVKVVWSNIEKQNAQIDEVKIACGNLKTDVIIQQERTLVQGENVKEIKADVKELKTGMDELKALLKDIKNKK